MSKISYSKIRTYSECGKKYDLRYNKGYSSKLSKSFFLIGSALDHGMNVLLKEKDLKKAINAFDKSWRFNYINGKYIHVASFSDIVYSKRDFDKDLLQKEDFDKFQELQTSLNTKYTNLLEAYSQIMDKKESNGFNNLSFEDKRLLSNANWLSMRRKSHIMLKGYHDKILPQIKELLAVQKRMSVKNSAGDEILGYLDLAVTWKDGKNYLLDNKTSYMEYEQDSASKSRQLIQYYYFEKENLKLNGVGYIVLYKQIVKNRVKICSKCNFNGSGKNHKTCSNEINSVRCHGEWIETINPECRIDVILNDVSEAAENLVIDAIDIANNGIKQGIFNPNLEACGSLNSEYRCEMYEYCWHGDSSNLIQIEKKK